NAASSPAWARVMRFVVTDHLRDSSGPHGTGTRVDTVGAEKWAVGPLIRRCRRCLSGWPSPWFEGSSDDAGWPAEETMIMLLKGKQALVCAASGAIASEVSRRFAAEGARVWVTARRGDAVLRLVDEIGDLGGEARGEQVDATDPTEVDRYIDRVAS